jgi:putative nucleotidyltransferase with HDIG domain
LLKDTATKPQGELIDANTRAQVASLSVSCRSAGIACAVVDEAGTILWSDGQAGDFANRFVLPLVTQQGIDAEVLNERYALQSDWIAIESRKAWPRVLLAARTDRFDAGEFVAHACQRLGLDLKWLESSASHVPALPPEVFEAFVSMARATLTATSQSASAKLELGNLSEQLAGSYEELTLIYQLSSGMQVNRSADEFFAHACRDLIEVTQVRACGYVLCGPAGEMTVPKVFGQCGLEPSRLTKLGTSLLDRFRTDPKPIMINDTATNWLTPDLAPEVSRVLAVPMQRQEQLMGVLFCFDKTFEEFNTTDSKLLSSIANEVAVFLENANLFAETRGLLMGLLHAMTGAVDAKDSYTRGHSQRVALYSREIAAKAGLPDAFCDRVYMAGLLHDVGKIGVPEEVLRKPGKLTDEEFALMKQHVEIGARILRDVNQIQDLIPGVLHHHERFDGKGYPHHLASQDIPLLARVLCVADCFDAMTSNRTYRRALPIEVALMEIRRCAGTQFDPVLAEAFLAIGADRLGDLMRSVGEHDMSLPMLKAA